MFLVSYGTGFVVEPTISILTSEIFWWVFELTRIWIYNLLELVHSGRAVSDVEPAPLVFRVSDLYHTDVRGVAVA